MENKILVLVVALAAAIFSMDATAQTVVKDSVPITNGATKPNGGKTQVLPYDNPNRTGTPKPRGTQQPDGKRERVAPAGVPTMQELPKDKAPNNNDCGFINLDLFFRQHAITEQSIC